MALYLKLQDASSLRFASMPRCVQSPADYLAWHAEQVRDRGIARVWTSDLTVVARVNHGRWLADCLACYAGMFTHPEWRIACCANCGAVYRTVKFPDQIDDITRVLLERPRIDTQNWEPGEALWKLRAENLLHRVAS